MKHAGSIYFNKKLIIFAKRITRISIYHVMIPTLFVWLAILKKTGLLVLHDTFVYELDRLNIN